LPTFRDAQIARDRYFTIEAEKRLKDENVPELEMSRAAAAQVRKELGDTYDSVKLGKTPTFDHLLNELAVEERLDAMIDKSLKRLMHVRGVKSLVLSPSVAIRAQSSPVIDQTSAAPVIRRLSR
jgi:hypothetical protein